MVSRPVSDPSNLLLEAFAIASEENNPSAEVYRILQRLRVTGIITTKSREIELLCQAPHKNPNLLRCARS
jgi:hypothetical protein